MSSQPTIDDQFRDLAMKLDVASEDDLELLFQEFLVLVHQKVLLRRAADLLLSRDPLGDLSAHG
jgi:hypothetical protein